MIAHLLPRSNRIGMVDLYWYTGGLGEQLRLATSVHGDEPPGGLLDGLAYGDQAVIAQDRRLVWTESFGYSLALRCFVHYAGEVREQSMILVKRASVLGDGIEQPPECRPRFPVHGMRVRSGNHVRACSVYLRVNCKGRSIYRMLALDDLAMMVYQNQIRRADLAEVHPKGVHPEMV